MSNAGIQPEKTKKSDKLALSNVEDVKPNFPRQSRISKSIQRTLSTAKYESIVIKEELEEEIEWSSPQELEKKLNNWNTVLIERFKETQGRVLEELGLDHKKAYFRNHIEEKDDRPEPNDPILDNLSVDQTETCNDLDTL